MIFLTRKSTSGNRSIPPLHCIHCSESLSEMESYFGLKLSNYTVISRILTLEQAAIGYEIFCSSEMESYCFFRPVTIL